MPMEKNVLVIGGSVFTGRVFSIKASKSGKFELHVVNRGNYPMEFPRVTQYKCSRHSPRMIARLVPDITYDALVDFCAYNPGEISSVIDALSGRIKQYVLMSTAAVYAPSNRPVAETAPLLDISDKNAPVAPDLRGKIELERELAEACDKAGIKYTILRPAFIYGPYNSVQNEAFFIEQIARRHVIAVPADATSRFNFVYVLDIADALLACIGDKRAYNEIFNLSGPETLTYQALISDFERYNSGPFETREVTTEQAHEENIPFPFPLTEDALYDGRKIMRTFGFEYTPFSAGMEKTFNTLCSIYKV